MNSRLFDQLAATGSLVIVLGLGLTSYYFARQAERNTPQRPDPRSHAPDYFVDKPRLLRTRPDGAPGMRLTAERMVHIPLDNTVRFTTLSLTSQDPDRPVLVISAREGSGPDTGERIELTGDVRIRRAADPARNAPPLLVTTEQASILPQDEIIRSASPVHIASGDNLLSGTGMELAGRERTLTLDADVQGTFLPSTGPRPAPHPPRQ